MFKDFNNRYLVIAASVLVALVVLMVLSTWRFVPHTVANACNLLVALGIFGIAIKWINFKEGSFNLLRWQNALFFASLIWIVTGARTFFIKDPGFASYIPCTPFFLLAGYDFIQSKLPTGKRLDLPKTFVHNYSRLGWKWFTNPKLDYWLCYGGLPLPIALTSYSLVSRWNQGGGNTLLFLAKITWSIGVAAFVFHWTLAPFRISNYKDLVAMSSLARLSAIGYLFLLPPVKMTDLPAALFWFYITGLIETGYEKAVQRQQPAILADYEALEGPSLGL